MNSEASIKVKIRLLPPLSSITDKERIELSLKEGATIKTIIDNLIEIFEDERLRLLLYDKKGQFIPAWNVFINNKQVGQLRSQKGLAKSVADGDEITFLFNMAGG